MRCSFVFYLAFYGLVVATDVTKNDSSIFVPTKEWKTVKKGTPIPTSLHIRHNFVTGITEAKLMDEDEVEQKTKDNTNSSQKHSLTPHPDKFVTDEKSKLLRIEEPTDQSKISFDELKSMLKKIKSDESDSESKNNEQNPSERKRTFRSYSELKDEMAAMNMNVSTDSEVITSLFHQFEPYQESITSDNLDLSDVEEILEILNDLEYLIHQIDNAQLFTKMGGMAKIISPSLNSTNSEIRAEALKLLGAAVQSNPRVQLKALENDFVQKLLRMLTLSNKIEIKSRCLFALGALVRNFPAAQKALVNNGGLEMFGKILADGDLQIQTRVINLITDLTIERQNLKEIQDVEQLLRRKKEYDITNFEEKLVLQNYCQNLVELMIKSLNVNSEIDDFHDAIYESMVTLSYICKADLMVKKDVLLPQIQKMLITYRDFPQVSEDGEDLNSNHQELLEKLQNTISQDQHDEL